MKRQFIKIFKVKTCLVPLVLMALSFSVIYKLCGILTKHFFHWETYPFFEIEKILVSCILTGLCTVVITKLLNKKIQIYSKLKLKLYVFLIRHYWTSNSTIFCKIAESFINIIYKSDFIPIQEQTSIIRKILDVLTQVSNGNSTTRLFIITGESHSGKTILSKKLLSDIFTQKEYLKIFNKYNKNIFYYDIACPEINLEKIQNNYTNNYYKDHFIIFDNIHKMADNQIKRLLKKVIQDPYKAICILILTRNIDYLLTDQLMSDINEGIKNHVISTEYLSTPLFDNTCDLSEEFKSFLEELDLDPELLENSYIKFHLYYVYHVYSKNRNACIKELYNSVKHKEYDLPIVQGFIFLCCNALFTGIVDTKIIKKFLPRKNSSFYLKSYIDLGILNGFHGIETWEYSIHEKTAQSYITYICKDDNGLELCEKYFRFLYTNTSGQLQYRYSIPFNDLYDKNDFNRIVNTGHFKSLREDLNFIIETFRLDKRNYNYELGILSDRIGDFKLTKKSILELYNDSKDLKYLILLLHSDHMMYYDINFFPLYTRMAENKNVYIRFATNYWVYHINMHQGIWDIDKYSDLSNILPSDLDSISNESYESCHVLRRYYFDCFRIYYLQGNGNYQNFVNLLNKMNKIRNYLNKKLDEFSMYENKFIYAHYIHYELLFRYYALEVTYIEPKELKMVDCNINSDLKNKAVNYYYKSYKYFYENGDKTYYYVLLRLCELSPEFVLLHITRTIETPLDFCEFTQDNYRTIIGILDRFRDECGIQQNMLEYAAYAETYKMKFIMLYKLTCSDLDLDLDSAIKEASQNTINYHTQYNPHHPNDYGILRVNLLNSINQFLINHNNAAFHKELNRLKGICISKQYNRELSIINKIGKMDLSQEIKRLRNIIMFYPIVLQ